MYRHTGEGIVAGWGLVSSASQYSSDVLMHVSLPFVDMGECRKIYGPVAQADGSQLCAGKGRGKDSCGGDSGKLFLMMLILPLIFLHQSPGT